MDRMFSSIPYVHNQPSYYTSNDNNNRSEINIQRIEQVENNAKLLGPSSVCSIPPHLEQACICPTLVFHQSDISSSSIQHQSIISPPSINQPTSFCVLVLSHLPGTCSPLFITRVRNFTCCMRLGPGFSDT